VAEGTPTLVEVRLGVREELAVVVGAPVVVSSVDVLGSVVVALGGGLVGPVVLGASDVVAGAWDVDAGAAGPFTSVVVPAGVATVSGRT
jgi:hypothetical protein